MPQSKAIMLTIMSDIDGSARGENREYAGRFIAKTGGVGGAVLDLEAGTEA
jgi:hypothetical protein